MICERNERFLVAVAMGYESSQLPTGTALLGVARWNGNTGCNPTTQAGSCASEIVWSGSAPAGCLNRKLVACLVDPC